MTWVNRQDDRIWVLQIFMFLILFLCFRFLQSLYSFSCPPYTNFQVSSFKHDGVFRVLVWGNHQEPYHAWILYAGFYSEYFQMNIKSFIYDKRKHSLLSIFIDTKAWIMTFRNWEMLSAHSCYVGKLHFTCCNEGLQHKVNMNGRRDRNSQCPTYIEKMIFFE